MKKITPAVKNIKRKKPLPNRPTNLGELLNDRLARLKNILDAKLVKPISTGLWRQLEDKLGTKIHNQTREKLYEQLKPQLKKDLQKIK